MYSNELGAWMACEHPVAGVQQFGVAGEIPSIERPVGVIVQFFESLIEAINGQKECFGVRYMNRDGHIKRAASVPHGIEARIIHLDQGTGTYMFSQI